MSPHAPSDIAARARARFLRLREEALAVRDAPMGRDQPRDPVPSGLCVSTVSRMITGFSAAAPAIAALQADLAQIDELRLYPRDAVHLTLLGCGQRGDAAEPGSARMAVIHEAVEGVVTSLPPQQMLIERVGVVGSQVFLEVVPLTDRWARARLALARALREAGQQPMSFPDPEPIHINVARFPAAPDRAAVMSVLSLPSARLDLMIEVSRIELVIADFMLTPGVTRFLWSGGMAA